MILFKVILILAKSSYHYAKYLVHHRPLSKKQSQKANNHYLDYVNEAGKLLAQ